MSEKEIILSEFGDALLHNFGDNHELIGRVGTHNKCSGEMFVIPVHIHKALTCLKCGWRTTALLGVKTIGRLRDNFRCYNCEKEKS